MSVCGLFLLDRYSETPGPSAAAPPEWPAESGLPRTGRPALVVFAHPECTCTRATLEVLAEIVHEARGACDVTVVIAAGDSDAASGEIAERARAIRGVRVVIDRGREAERFRALTSGFTVLYGRDGRLRFAGGITDARGHAGHSVGQSRIVALLRGEPEATVAVTAPTFGCELDTPGAPGAPGAP